MAMNLDLRVSLVLALLVVSLFPTLSLLLSLSSTPYTEERAVEVALHFLKASPTFSFDGIPNSVRVEAAEEVSAGSWRIAISFQCRYYGYGDRSGQILLPVITPHRMEVVVERGEVVEAVIDGVWDELHQRPLGG
ncbi:MAG: hypothetical protein AYL28_005030 [Candidatus Bathyarchaeota archaeon B23]|nr:MAG: hypothetical protein AYL28_005030 [Candidatus Bathyarchaeota archaeon B23]